MSKPSGLFGSGSYKWPLLLAGTLFLVSALFFAQRSLSSSPALTAGEVQTVPFGEVGGDFTLMQEGKPVSLSDFPGKAVVIYFGFASCPDVCPTTLGLVSASLKALAAEEMEQVQPIFISVDPERDKGKMLTDYAQYFHPKMIGVTGTPDEVKQVAKKYNTLFYKEKLSDSAMAYTVNHTSKTYVISKNGESMQILPHSMTKPELLASIRAAL
ncbi:MAG: SCO family protein [Thiolinea sp.]